MGVVGAGFGASVHVPGLRAIGGVTPVALLAESKESSSTAATRLGLTVARDIHDLLDHDLDAITVAVPPDRVESIVIPCLRRGLPVLCEKPLATDRASAERLVAASNGITTGLDFQFAELCTFRTTESWIRSGRLGPLRHVSIDWFVQSYVQRTRQFCWKVDAMRRGGVLSLLVSHALHCLERFAGPICALSAVLDERATRRFAPADASPAEDTAFLTATHASGTISSATIGNAAPGAPVHRWRLQCDGGAINLENTTGDYMGGFVMTVTGPDGEVLARAEEPGGEGDGRIAPFMHLAARFMKAARIGAPFSPSFHDGARAASLLDAARTASQSKRQVEIQT